MFTCHVNRGRPNCAASYKPHSGESTTTRLSLHPRQCSFTEAQANTRSIFLLVEPFISSAGHSRIKTKTLSLTMWPLLPVQSIGFKTFFSFLSCPWKINWTQNVALLNRTKKQKIHVGLSFFSTYHMTTNTYHIYMIKNTALSCFEENVITIEIAMHITCLSKQITDRFIN